MRKVALIVTLCAWLGAAHPLKAANHTVSDEDVARVHRSAILIDTHNDIPSRTVDGADIGSDLKEKGAHTDIARLRAGGVSAVFFAAYVDAGYVAGNHSAHRALDMIDTIRTDIVGKHPSDFLFATTADDIEAAHKQGKIAALIGIEGGHAIEDSLRLLRDYYRLGVRYMTLTHMNTNNWADSSGDISDPAVKHHNGLTDFGRDVVREMNRLGMMVDISHVSDKTFWDVLEVSSAPVIASHSSCRAVSDVPRNMTDDMIRAIAKNGGVIQINFACDFLSQRYATEVKPLDDAMKKRWAEIHEQYKNDTEAMSRELSKLEDSYKPNIPPATLDDVVEQIDHAVKVAGVDHVGIGSDFDGITCTPAGLDDVSKFPSLTRALLEKGYSAEDIRKIYGGNLLRVMRAVENAAQKGGVR